MKAKQLAAEKAVDYVENGMIVGLGTGSTANWAIKKIGQRVRTGLDILTVSSSLKSEELARASGIAITDFSQISRIDLYIDGADEIDEKYNLVKGGGASLLREKILAFNSKKFIVIADEAKLVNVLGAYPLPVEVTPFAFEFTIRRLQLLGCKPRIRKAGPEIYITDNSNYIVDCAFGVIDDLATLDSRIRSIPGIVETGLFSNTMVHSVIIGYESGDVKEFKNNLS